MTTEEIKYLITKESEKYGLNPSIAIAVCQIESSFNVLATGDAGKSHGLFQIYENGLLLEIKKENPTITIENLYNPETNIKWGVWYLGKKIPQYLTTYKHAHNIKNLIIAYNAGIGNLNKGNFPLSTVEYITRLERITGLKSSQSFKKKVLALPSLLCPHCSQSVIVELKSV